MRLSIIYIVAITVWAAPSLGAFSLDSGLSIAAENDDVLPAILLLLDDSVADEPAIPEEPQIAWADSYSADGQCYCMSDYDKGIADTIVDTAYGQMTVRQICADIGPGPGSEGQPLYNDVQCGNGPANDEANETFCPGRVDSGIDGCPEVGPTWTYPEPTVVVANPEVNEGPLQNPLKGFHLGFFASCCPDIALQEVYFGNYMATVGYQNFKWADLEPNDDDFRWDIVDDELSNKAGSKQKHVIVQLNAEWVRGDRDGRTPAWFLNDPRFEENVDDDEVYRSHKYESDFYQEEVKEFIAEFVNRFKDDPRVFIIQMGMVGYFGEFNVFPNDDLWLPDEVKTTFFEHYRDHVFGEVERETPGDSTSKLIVLEDGADGFNSQSYNGYSALTQVRYPAELGYNVPTDGIGYTNGWVNLDGIPGDANNDDDIGNKDFNDPISTLLADDGRNPWAFGPVGGEWPPSREPPGDIIEEINGEDRVVVLGGEGVIEEWTSFWGAGDGQGKGEDYINRGRYSFARPPQVDTISRLLGRENWSLIPENWNRFVDNAGDLATNYPDYSNAGGDLFREWHRMIGYNYQLANIQHFFVADKTRINVSFDVSNIGLAAFHFDWDVELAILDSANTVMQLIPVEDADMRTWLPGGASSVSATADLNFDIKQGDQEYRIALRMVQPGATDTKDELWRLDENVTYVVISNDVDVVEGEWNEQNQLVGGWNILDTAQ